MPPSESVTDVVEAEEVTIVVTARDGKIQLALPGTWSKAPKSQREEGLRSSVGRF